MCFLYIRVISKGYIRDFGKVFRTSAYCITTKIKRLFDVLNTSYCGFDKVFTTSVERLKGRLKNVTMTC